MYVNEVDSIAEEFGEPVRDQPWYKREVWLTDPDGNRWRIGAPGTSQEKVCNRGWDDGKGEMMKLTIDVEHATVQTARTE